MASTSCSRLTPQASECSPHATSVSTADPPAWVPATDYWAFYPHLSQPFDVADCKWANSGHRPKAFLAGRALDLVPEHKRHKASQVIKDKDVALRNATATDVIVSADENVVHINYVEHAHMHVEKCAAGNLEHPDALVCCLTWLKKIDEGNKVMLLFLCVFQKQPFNVPVSAHSCVLLVSTAH